MVFSVNLAALNLAIYTNPQERKFIRTGILDSTTISHTTAFHENSNEYQWQVGKQDIVLMNPPFTRKQSILAFGDGYREKLVQRCADK